MTGMRPEEDIRILPQDETDRRFATTLARGLAVLRAFRASDDGLGNAEISERTGIPKSTVSRLTFTLQSLGYLNHARRHDRYRPGPALLALGNVATSSISFVELAGPIMQRVADETGTMSLLLVRDDKKLLILKTWRPRGISSLWLEIGHRLPFNGTSSGHALLAAMPEDVFEKTVANVAGAGGLTPERALEIRRDAWGRSSRRASRSPIPTSITPPISTPWRGPSIPAISRSPWSSPAGRCPRRSVSNGCGKRSARS